MLINVKEISTHSFFFWSLVLLMSLVEDNCFLIYSDIDLFHYDWSASLRLFCVPCYWSFFLVTDMLSLWLICFPWDWSVSLCLVRFPCDWSVFPVTDLCSLWLITMYQLVPCLLFLPFCACCSFTLFPDVTTLTTTSTTSTTSTSINMTIQSFLK